MARKPWRSFLLMCTALVFSACADQAPRPTVRAAWARPAEKGMNSAIYMQVQNGSRSDALIGASSEAAQMVQIHQTVINADGVAEMKPQSRIELAPGEVLELKPGGYHIMLMDVFQPLLVGDSLDVTLLFEEAGEVYVQVTVKTD
jgi:copper(I)-binding protein